MKKLILLITFSVLFFATNVNAINLKVMGYSDQYEPLELSCIAKVINQTSTLASKLGFNLELYGVSSDKPDYDCHPAIFNTYACWAATKYKSDKTIISAIFKSNHLRDFEGISSVDSFLDRGGTAVAVVVGDCSTEHNKLFSAWVLLHEILHTLGAGHLRPGRSGLDLMNPYLSDETVARFGVNVPVSSEILKKIKRNVRAKVKNRIKACRRNFKGSFKKSCLNSYKSIVRG